jgi:TorA maturation chaperone TorD
MLKGLAIEEPSGPAAVEPPLSPEELAESCAARLAMYRLLSGVFVEEPSAELLAALREPAALEALAEVGLRFEADFTETGIAELADELACEFTTLFAASGGFPPIESVRLTGRYQQDPHFAVEAEYRRAGFEVAKGRFLVLADQLGVELAFVAELLERSRAALERDDVAAFQRLERDVKRFWALHLGRWVRGYARLVECATEHSFYREMAKLLGAFAAEELALMRLRVDDWDQGKEVVPKSEVKVLFDPDEPVCNACGGAG